MLFSGSIQRYKHATELTWICKQGAAGGKDVVLAAVQQNGQVLPFASKELQKDEEVVLAAEKQKEEAREKRST